jgi:acyl-Coa thioesterase superfamily protein/acyl-CoA thioesterase superfamily protein
MNASIFEPVGELFLPTEAALSVWSDQLLFGGTTAMLMARELERFPADQPMFIARLTVELMRPVGRIPLAVRSRLVRPGRKVQLVEASLWNGELEVARATGLRMRPAQIEVPRDDEPPPHGPPEAATGWGATGHRTGPGYHVLGVEARGLVPSVGRLGPNWAWFRLKLPLVPGEEPSGLVRICAAADFPNGISNIVEPAVTTYLNPDLTVYVHRPPVDEWVMVDARTWLERHGTGLAEGALYDRRGRIGRSLQSLLVEPH